MNLFGTQKMEVSEAMDLTVSGLAEYGARHDHWIIAWSGGKDSTCALTVVLYLILSGQVRAPKSLTVLYADTRMELLPLAASALLIMARIREIAASPEWQATGCELSVEAVMAEMDKRFFVYMLGRGVPPPNNNTLRWCTRQIKVDPMKRRIEQEFFRRNPGLAELDRKEWPSDVDRPLTLTGVRIGESAVRDGRIALSCSRNGAECGQGWYQETLPGDITSTYAPILHWRLCGVWDWLRIFAPMPKFGGWDTTMLAEAYGDDKAKENAARTGCNGCPLANEDLALDNLLALYPEQWGYLAPIKRIRPLYRELREPRWRHRKHGETLKSGQYSKSPNRMGPLTLQARLYALDQILRIQEEINGEADRLDRPRIDMLNDEEEARIRYLVASGMYPERWSADDPLATEDFVTVFSDGTAQSTLFYGN